MRRPDIRHIFLFYELCHSTGYDAAQNAGDKELGHALHADQQHHEHEGVRSALDGHEVLHVVTAVEGQHDVATVIPVRSSIPMRIRDCWKRR